MARIDSMNQEVPKKKCEPRAYEICEGSPFADVFTLEVYNPLTRLEIYRWVAKFLASQGLGKSEADILYSLQQRHSRVWEQGAGRCVVTVFEMGTLSRSVVLKARLLYQDANGHPRKPERNCFLFFIKTGNHRDDYRRILASIEDLMKAEDLNPPASGLPLREDLQRFFQDQLKGDQR